MPFLFPFITVLGAFWCLGSRRYVFEVFRIFKLYLLRIKDGKRFEEVRLLAYSLAEGKNSLHSA